MNFYEQFAYLTEKVNMARLVIVVTIVTLIVIIIVLLGSCAYTGIPFIDQKPIGEPSPFLTSSAIPRLNPKGGEEVGREAEQSSSNSNVPPIPGANLLISVIDEQGQTVEQGIIEVSVEYQDFPDRNYQYSVDLTSIQDGLLALYPPPSHILATVSLRAVTPDGKTSDTLVIKNDEYWNTVKVIEREFVASHEFNFGKSGTVTNIIYD